MDPRYVLIGSVLLMFVVQAIADGIVHKASVELDSETRDKISRREDQAFLFWRIFDGIGMAMMVAGLLKMVGILRFGPPWGIPVMVLGLVVVGIGRILRVWSTKASFAAEAPGSKASKAAVSSALLVTIGEIALCGLVFYYTSANFKTLINALSGPSKNPPAATTPGSTLPNIVSDSPTKKPNDPLWIDEAAALEKIKGRGKEYLAALVDKAHVRTDMQGGKKMYRRDDFEAMLEFPSHEELGLKKP